MENDSARQTGDENQPTRREILLASGAAMGGLLGLMSPFQAADANDDACCPARIPMPASVQPISLADTARGNQQAMAIARRSRLAQTAHDALLAIARSLPDVAVRQATIDVLANPNSRVHLASPSDGDKATVRRELLDAGLIADRVPVEGIFPPVADPAQAPQPIWSAPGSTYSGHHAYPGGLVVHEWVNAGIAKAFVEHYDHAYKLGAIPGSLDVSTALAVPLWHDIHKVTVFQWNADGSEFTEYPIADTGAHHPLTGAEAILRGMPNSFVVAILSAHDAPTTVRSNPTQTGIQRLVNYIRAAAIIARRDPVALGLLERMPDGTLGLAQHPPRIEGFIAHLSDHDFVFSNDSMTVLIAGLKQLARQYGIDPDGATPRFNLFRNLVFSQVSDMRLYGVLVASGLPGVKDIIDREVDLSQLTA